MNNHDSLAGHAPGCAIRRNGLADCNCDIRLAYPHRLAKVDVTDYEKGYAAGVEAAAQTAAKGSYFFDGTRGTIEGQIAESIRALAVTPKAVEPIAHGLKGGHLMPDGRECGYLSLGVCNKCGAVGLPK